MPSKHPLRSIRSIGILQQWSLTWISFVSKMSDIKQTCLGQGLGVTITARKRTSKVKNLGHTSDLFCLVVKIEHLQVTVDVVTLKKPYKSQR